MKKNITNDAFLSAEGKSPKPVNHGGMSPAQFVYWLQGFFENVNPQTINAAQTQSIKNHLQEVFHKVTPSIPMENMAQTLVCDTGENLLAC